MFSFRALLLQHGYWLVFVYIVAVDLGMPIPADPLLLIMGALVGDRKYTLLPSLLTAVGAAILGDLSWYEIGRYRGRSVLGLLCKLSLEADTCVRKTESAFTRGGSATLLFAKFIPGISILSMAMAGITRMPRWKFLLADIAGSALWSATYLLLGRLFYRQVDRIIAWLGLFGSRAGVVFLLLISLYIAAKYGQRRWFLRRLRTDRVSPEQVNGWLEANYPPLTIVDLRNPVEIEMDGLKIAGALVLRPDQLRSRSGEIPRDQEIILYCS